MTEGSEIQIALVGLQRPAIRQPAVYDPGGGSPRMRLCPVGTEDVYDFEPTRFEAVGD